MPRGCFASQAQSLCPSCAHSHTRPPVGGIGRGPAWLLKSTSVVSCQWLHGASLPLPGSTGRGLRSRQDGAMSPEVAIIITDGSRTLACPQAHWEDSFSQNHNCGHTNPCQGSRNCSHLEQVLAHHGSGTEPGKGTGSDQIRLARALKLEMVPARDGKWLFSPLPSWVWPVGSEVLVPLAGHIKSRMDCGGNQPQELVHSDEMDLVISKVLPFGDRHNHWNFLKHGKMQVTRYESS